MEFIMAVIIIFIVYKIAGYMIEGYNSNDIPNKLPQNTPTKVFIPQNISIMGFDEDFTPNKKFSIDVVGETFKNDDGTNRQEIIKKYAKAGNFVNLKFYMFKGYLACGVYLDKYMIGNIPAQYAESLYNYIKANNGVLATIKSVGKAKDTDKYGVSLMVEANS